MLITTNAPASFSRVNNQPAVAAKEESIASMPQESFTLSGQTQNHYSGGSVLRRAAGGAITGLLANTFSDGSVWGTAKLGAMVDGGIGVVVGGLGGAVAGAAAGNAGAGALVGAGVLGGIGAVSGGVKGALIGVVGNAFGGGPVAFAASGAVLGALGL